VSTAVRRYAAADQRRAPHVGRARRSVNVGGEMLHIIAEYSAP